jgi:hypothetical protein
MSADESPMAIAITLRSAESTGSAPIEHCSSNNNPGSDRSTCNSSSSNPGNGICSAAADTSSCSSNLVQGNVLGKSGPRARRGGRSRTNQRKGDMVAFTSRQRDILDETRKRLKLHEKYRDKIETWSSLKNLAIDLNFIYGCDR